MLVDVVGVVVVIVADDVVVTTVVEVVVGVAVVVNCCVFKEVDVILIVVDGKLVAETKIKM